MTDTLTLPEDIAVKKRSIRIAGHSSSITLEQPFWDILHHIAQERDISMAQLVSDIDRSRAHDAGGSNLSGTIRVYILMYLTAKIPDAVFAQ